VNHPRRGLDVKVVDETSIASNSLRAHAASAGHNVIGL
jgi:hypothetical protein